MCKSNVLSPQHRLVGCKGIAPLILNFGYRWEWSATHPGLFIPGEG